MNPFQPHSHTADHEFHDPIEVFDSQDLGPKVVEMFRDFGGENPATALLTRIFWFDVDCHLVWDTQFRTKRPTPSEAARDRALIYGLLNLVAGPPSQTYEEDLFSPARSLSRWQRTTHTLLRLEESQRPDGPWLYGWAQFGVELSREARAPRIALRDRRLCLAIDRDEPPIEAFADELPYELDEFLSLYGVDPALAKQTEERLVKTLLDPQRDAPTMSETL